MKHKTMSLLLFLSLLALLSPIQSMAQSRCSSSSGRGRNGAFISGAQSALLGGSGFGIANAPLLGGSGFGIANAPLGLLGGPGLRVGNTRFGLFDGPGILNYDYKHVWMPGPAGAITVIGAGAGGGAVAGALLSHKDKKKKGALIGAAAGAGGATVLWLYKNRTERRAIF